MNSFSFNHLEKPHIYLGTNLEVPNPRSVLWSHPWDDVASAVWSRTPQVLLQYDDVSLPLVVLTGGTMTTQKHAFIKSCLVKFIHDTSDRIRDEHFCIVFQKRNHHRRTHENTLEQKHWKWRRRKTWLCCWSKDRIKTSKPARYTSHREVQESKTAHHIS